ncbi:MAG: hypothetical protein P4L49_14135 [Desulfosporosinus sp.]|nr:hypothetical protein [Desulfosporosinus sp.]
MKNARRKYYFCWVLVLAFLLFHTPHVHAAPPELNDPALKYRGSRLRLEVAITAEAV